MSRSILSLSKIAHQMWHDHPFSQRNRTTERSVGLQVGGDREMGGGEGVGQNLEKGGGVGNIGGGALQKIGVSAPLCQLCKETLKIFHPLHYCLVEEQCSCVCATSRKTGQH